MKLFKAILQNMKLYEHLKLTAAQFKTREVSI